MCERLFQVGNLGKLRVLSESVKMASKRNTSPEVLDEAAKEKQKDEVGQRTGGPQDAQSRSLSVSSLDCSSEQPPSSHTAQVVEVDEQILSISTSDPHLYHRASTEQGTHSIPEPGNTSSHSHLPQARGISGTGTARNQESTTSRGMGRPCQNPQLQQAMPSNDSTVIKRRVRPRKVELLLRDYRQFLTKANSEHIIPTTETILSESCVAQTRGRILRSDKDTNHQDVPLSVTCRPQKNIQSSEDAIMISCRRGRPSKNRPVQKHTVNKEPLVKGRLHRQNRGIHHRARNCQSVQKKLRTTQTWRPRGGLSWTSTSNTRLRHHLTQCSSTSYPVNATESKATDCLELWNICNSHLTTANTEELKVKSFEFGYKEPYILLTRVDRQKELTSDMMNIKESQKKQENPIDFSEEINKTFHRADRQNKEMDVKRNPLEDVNSMIDIVASLKGDTDSCQRTVQEDGSSGAELSRPLAKLSISTIDRTGTPNSSLICGLSDVDNTEMGKKNNLFHAEAGMEVEIGKEEMNDEKREDEKPTYSECTEGALCQETLRFSEKLSEKLSDSHVAIQAGSCQHCSSIFGPDPCSGCTCVSKSLDQIQTKKACFENDMENSDSKDKVVECREFDEALQKNKELNANSVACAWPQKSIHECTLRTVEDISENLLRKIEEEKNFYKAPEFPSCDIEVMTSDPSVKNVHEQKHFVSELNPFNLESLAESDYSEPNHSSSQLNTNAVEVLSWGCGFSGKREQFKTCRHSDFCSEGKVIEGQNFVTSSETSVEVVDSFTGEPSVSGSKDYNRQSRDGQNNDMNCSDESQQKILVEHPACKQTDFIAELKDEGQKEPVSDCASISDQGFDDEHYASEQENIVSEINTVDQIDFHNGTYISGEKKQMLAIESAEQNYFISEWKGLPRPMEDISNQSWHSPGEKSQ